VDRESQTVRLQLLPQADQSRGNNQLAVVKGMAVQNGGLWVQSPELELRDLPGDTPNRLRKARAN
jgi:hypothetical protein